jgi:hypothetical protein
MAMADQASKLATGAKTLAETPLRGGNALEALTG